MNYSTGPPSLLASSTSALSPPTFHTQRLAKCIRRHSLREFVFCSSEENYRVSVMVLLFEPENGGSIFLRNAGILRWALAELVNSYQNLTDIKY
jgi:hypothetical protein